MEPISAIALSVALGAGAIAGKEVVSGVVKDAYAALKGLIRSRYPTVSVEQLEQAPSSKNRRAVIEEDLANSEAGKDGELVDAANQPATPTITDPAHSRLLTVSIRGPSLITFIRTDGNAPGLSPPSTQASPNTNIDAHRTT